MKKILILTVTAGNAHNACARIMKEEIERTTEAEVRIVDLFRSFSSAQQVWVEDTGYNISVSRFRHIYNAFYNHYKKLDPATRYTNATQNACIATTDGLLQYILEFQPDAIFCTHYAGAIALADLRLAFSLPCTVITTCLDFVLSPFWESAIGVDYFVIPNEDFIEECLYEGFRREQLLPYGLPVNTLEGVDRTSARKELGLQDKFTALILFGGGSWKGGYDIYRMAARALKGRNARLIVVNGKDEKSYQKIEKEKRDDGLEIVNVGFTDKLPLYLCAADVVINKCGGASTAETMNAGRPMIAYEKIPAQELYNLEYLKKCGTALSFKNEKELCMHLTKLMDDANLREEMSRNTEKLKSNALQRVAQKLVSVPTADYTATREYASLKPKEIKKRVRTALKEANKELHK